MDLSLAIVASIVSVITIITSQRFFINQNILDKIINRSSHKVIATRSGGFAVFSTIFLISIYYYINGNTIYDYSVLVPIGILFSIGLYDDVFNVDFKLKFIFQIIAAKIIIDNGLIVDNFHGLFGIFEINRLLAQLMTIFIIAAIINAMNFIDGIDGLAISVFSLFLVLFEMFSLNATGLENLTTIILFALIPLYFFNFKKSKKVFLGDSGSLMIGGITSIYVLNILSNDYIIKEDFDLNKIIFVFSVLFYPILDITRITIKRLIEKKSPFEADNNHIHHILLSYLKDHYKVVVSLLLSTLMVIVFVQLLFN